MGSVLASRKPYRISWQSFEFRASWKSGLLGLCIGPCCWKPQATKTTRKTSSHELPQRPRPKKNGSAPCHGQSSSTQSLRATELQAGHQATPRQQQQLHFPKQKSPGSGCQSEAKVELSEVAAGPISSSAYLVW